MTSDADSADRDTADPGPRWRLRIDGQVFGPFDRDRLAALAAQGRIGPHTDLAPEGETSWRPLGAVPEIAALLPEIPPEAGPAAPLAEAIGRDPAPASPVPRVGRPRVLDQARVSVLIDDAADGDGVGDGPDEIRATTLAHVAYGLVAFGLLVTLVGAVGALVAHIQARRRAGTWLAGHFVWLYRSFWMFLVLALVGIVFGVGGAGRPGALILVADCAWFVWRLVQGWRRLRRREPIDNPDAWI